MSPAATDHPAHLTDHRSVLGTNGCGATSAIGVLAVAWSLVSGCAEPADGMDAPMVDGTDGSTTSDASASTTSTTTGDMDDSNDVTSTSTTTGDDGSSGGSDDSGTPPGVGSSCGAASLLSPGRYVGVEIDVGGVSRTYDLFVPPSYDPDEATSLVLNFHGLYGSPTHQAGFSQFDDTATDRGIVVAYPVGIGASFNSGVCCGTASQNDVDDVGFARALVADVSSKLCIDPKRVYATGMSNGGHMAHRLACEAADVFAATASVAGVLNTVAPCAPGRPISVIQFHGDKDTIVGYHAIPDVPQMMENWAARNGCSDQPETTFDQGDMLCRTWPGCDGGVEVSLCTVEDGGHCWPGNASCLFGQSSTELHASEVIADMFEAQVMP